MSNVIWKYLLGPESAHTLSMPAGAEVIHADIQRGEFCLWAIIPDQSAEKENRYFLIAPTGGPGDSRVIKKNHITTFLDGMYVWHVFEVG
jgi:hypothetical protein